MKMRKVEYYRLWDDSTWDTDFIDIPADTPEHKREEAVRAEAMKIDWQGDSMPVAFGMFWDTPDEDEEGR